MPRLPTIQEYINKHGDNCYIYSFDTDTDIEETDEITDSEFDDLIESESSIDKEEVCLEYNDNGYLTLFDEYYKVGHRPTNTLITQILSEYYSPTQIFSYFGINPKHAKHITDWLVVIDYQSVGNLALKFSFFSSNDGFLISNTKRLVYA